MLSLTGEEVHATPLYGYPLPPPVPGRFAPKFNGNGQYRLPDPVSGKPTSYTRASTVAKALEDTHMLDSWAKRMMLIGIQGSIPLAADLDQLISEHLADGGNESTMAKDLRDPLNALSDTAQERAGAGRGAEFGTAVHAWCEWVDIGTGYLWEVPEMFRPWVTAHRRILAENAIRVHPEWTERVVLNAQFGIAGTLDRLYWCPDMNMRLGDIKTSKGLDFSWLYFAIQLAIYHGATHILSLDGKTWEPMPHLMPDVALISHLPREDPDASSMVPIDMEFGHEALHMAVQVRKLRTRAERDVRPVRYALGSEDTTEVRWHMAHFGIETSRTEAAMAAVWDEYQDVWTPELTELGRALLASANINANIKGTS